MMNNDGLINYKYGQSIDMDKRIALGSKTRAQPRRKENDEKMRCEDSAEFQSLPI